MSNEDTLQTLVESFGALADEVQTLMDCKTILLHKLKFAHEEFQYLADKYAPAAPEILETLAKLQVSPDLQHPTLTNTGFVPLPKRGRSDDSQHQIALLIREGRRAAQHLSAVTDVSKSGSSKATASPTTMTSMSTMLEQDFTVQGKKGKLGCPFSSEAQVEDVNHVDQVDGSNEAQDQTRHRPGDPICAAMLEETKSQSAPTSVTAPKCPIRFMDQHSPEEIANYVETHKHQLPRSHTVCVQRYQKNEDQIRKLDAKYGNLVSMIKDLSQLHQPMLPSDEGEIQDEVDRASNERVENWAQEVRASTADDPHATEDDASDPDGDMDRESHFDRPLKEVRVGESPSRPWGISVPLYDAATHASEAPAPVRMPSTAPSETSSKPREDGGVLKCPFDHTKFAPHAATSSPMAKAEDKDTADDVDDDHMELPFTPLKPAPPSSPPRAAFINPDASKNTQHQGPQMLFTGPVFIGYPIEQAIEFMQHFQKN